MQNQYQQSPSGKGQPMTDQYQQNQQMQNQYQQNPQNQPMTDQYQQNPQMQGQYQQPQMTGQYQQPQMKGQYQQPQMTGQYQQPQKQGQYQQPLMQRQYHQPQMQGQYHQPMINQYQQPPMVNQYQHSSSMSKVFKSAAPMANQYHSSSSMPPVVNKIIANQQFQGTYMNQTIPHIHPVVSQDFTSRYRCDICKRLGDEIICYSCRTCDMDICQICCNKLLCAPQKNRHHQLYLTKRENWHCDLCQKRG